MRFGRLCHVQLLLLLVSLLLLLGLGFRLRLRQGPAGSQIRTTLHMQARAATRSLAHSATPTAIKAVQAQSLVYNT
jgi:hypothetical protein